MTSETLRESSALINDRDYYKRVCSVKCKTATGKRCKCVCNRANHGIHFSEIEEAARIHDIRKMLEARSYFRRAMAFLQRVFPNRYQPSKASLRR